MGLTEQGLGGKAKQSALRTALDTRTTDTEDFREAARETTTLLGPDSSVHSEHDYERLWQYFGALPSAHEAGPVCKFARWMSIQE